MVLKVAPLGIGIAYTGAFLGAFSKIKFANVSKGMNRPGF